MNVANVEDSEKWESEKPNLYVLGTKKNIHQDVQAKTMKILMVLDAKSVMVHMKKMDQGVKAKKMRILMVQDAKSVMVHMKRMVEGVGVGMIRTKRIFEDMAKIVQDPMRLDEAVITDLECDP